MDRELLQQRIADIRTELSHANELADDHRQELEHLLDELQQLVDQGQPLESISQTQSQLNASLVRFEADHPRLAVVVTQVIEMLNRIGI